MVERRWAVRELLMVDVMVYVCDDGWMAMKDSICLLTCTIIGEGMLTDACFYWFG